MLLRALSLDQPIASIFMLYQYGLVGYPLTHSFSAAYFTQKFAQLQLAQHSYQLMPLPHIAQLPALLDQQPHLLGFNVTIPHKQSILSYTHHQSPAVQQIGATNCIVVGQNKQLAAHNTDAVGFEQSLLPLLHSHHRRALVLGNGGSSKAVQWVLQGLGIGYTVASRHPATAQHISYPQIDEQVLHTHHIIINTSPVGMYPHTQQAPTLPYQWLSGQHLCYDLVYNPAPTLFLQKAAQQGAAVQNGLAMLYAQAEAAWQIWQNNAFF